MIIAKICACNRTKVKRIVPRKVKVRGETRWRIIVPVEMRGDGQRCFFFSDAEAAANKAERLESDRGKIGEAFHALGQREQALIIEALRRAGSPEALLAAVDRKSEPKKSLADVRDEFLKSKENENVSLKLQKCLKSVLKGFCAAQADKSVSEINPKIVEAWLNGSDWSPVTRRTYRGHLVMLFEFAVGREYISKNPAKAVKPPKVPKTSPVIHSVMEAKRLLNSAQQKDRGLIQFLALIYFGGHRPEEAAKANKKEWSAEHIEVGADKAKTERHRFIRRNPTLNAWLKVSGNFTRKNLRRRMERIRWLAKVPWVPDIMRHSFCSYGVAKYGADKIVEWSGHSRSVLFNTYRKPVLPKEANKFWSLRPKK